MRTDGDARSRICYPLPGIRIDVARLLGDLRRVDGGGWAAQDRYEPGRTNWTGVALYSVSGAADDLRCAARPDVVKTAAGERCSYVVNELLPQFQAPHLRVAFYRLEAGTTIGLHRDYGENRAMGSVRVHVPVITNPLVATYIGGEAHHFRVGEAWYFEASCAHQVENKGAADRIHLIVDLKPSPGLDTLLRPLDLTDRVRFARQRVAYYGRVAETAVRFATSREGRARIRAKARTLSFARRAV